MKRLVLIIYIISCATNNVFSQGNIMYPIGDKYIPIWNINNENMTILYPGNVHFGSTQGGMLGIGDFSIEGNSDVTIKANAIHFKNTHIGSTDPNFKVHASNKCLILASNYDYSNGLPQVPLYEKIEFGIELPEEIQNKIDLFLNSNSSAANPNHPGLNPYDPQDISVEATVTATLTDARYLINQQEYNESLPSSVTVYGFYFQDACPTPNLTGWTINTATPFPFRVRMAPPYKGTYNVTFKVTYWDNGGYSTIDLSGTTISANQNGGGTLSLDFQAVANTSGKAIAKGYIKVGKHKRHLRHSYDNTSFFPVGMNVPQPICASNPCVEPPTNPEGMANRRYEFTQLATNGGNYTRILSFGDRNSANCVEITNKKTWDPQFVLGNYQANQQTMAETDLDILTFENNGIFATWCLQTFGFDDANYNDNYSACWGSNPYKNELNKNNVTEFFTDSDCKRFFKNRLRYIQARWGYSASIAIYQLNSEIDDFGKYPIGTPPNLTWVNTYRYIPSYAQKGEVWQSSMAGHVKSIYPSHLISSSYVANPTQPVTQDPNEFPIACHDKFIYSNVCDIVSWNPYQDDSPNNGGVHNDINRGRWNAVNEIVYNPTIIESCNPDWNRFSDKPVFFSEAGMNDGFNIDPFTDIQMHNMIWATACSGMLGTGLNWQGWEAYTAGSQIEKKFQHFNAINSFFDDIDFETHKYTPSVDEVEKLIDKGGSIRVNENMDLEIFVMANDNAGLGEKSDRGFGWVHHNEANWNLRLQERWMNDDLSTPNVDEGHYVFDPIDTTLSLLSINPQTYNYKLNGFKPGSYLIDIYDTFSGNIIYSSNSSDDIHASLTNILTLGIPNVELFKNSYTERFDYGFKFWHSSVNGNDLRISPPHDCTLNISHNITLPGNDGNLKKYFLVSMLPNPASENISIKASGENINTLSITDLGGNLVYVKTSINLHKSDINISDLSPGAYFVYVKSNSAITKIFKLIKI